MENETTALVGAFDNRHSNIANDFKAKVTDILGGYTELVSMTTRQTWDKRVEESYEFTSPNGTTVRIQVTR